MHISFQESITTRDLHKAHVINICQTRKTAAFGHAFPSLKQQICICHNTRSHLMLVFLHYVCDIFVTNIKVENDNNENDDMIMIMMMTMMGMMMTMMNHEGDVCDGDKNSLN